MGLELGWNCINKLTKKCRSVHFFSIVAERKKSSCYNLAVPLIATSTRLNPVSYCLVDTRCT